MRTSPRQTCPRGQPRDRPARARSPVPRDSLRDALRAALVGLAVAACAPPAPAPAGPAARVLSQTVLSDEILWDLGPAAQARVVGVSVMADDPRYTRIAGRWSPDIPRLAATSEGLLARRPDLVIIAAFSAAELKALLAAQGVRVLEFAEFTGFADYRRHVREVAAAVDAAAEGEALLRAVDDRLAALAARRPADPPTAVSWSDGFTAAADTTFADIADAVGVVNLAARQGLSGHVPVTIERLVAWDPAYIVIACPAAAPADPACPAAEAEFAARPGLAVTTAARTGRVIAVPARDLASTGEGMLLTAEALQARVLAD